jgi:hypothetical protein
MAVGGIGYVYYSPLSIVRVTGVDMIYILNNTPILIFLVGVLLLSLFRVVSIVGLSQGPLRPFGA